MAQKHGKSHYAKEEDSQNKNLLKLYLNDVGLLTNVLFSYNASAVPDYNIKKGIVLSNNREVVTDGFISYMPVYYVMFLRPSNPVQYML